MNDRAQAVFRRLLSESSMDINRPIFLLGSGRSGTTILYRLMAVHPELCWFSNLTDRYPSHPKLAVFHRALDVPIVGGWMRQRLIERKRPSLRPSEAGTIYHSYCGFDSSRRMIADELTAEAEAKFKRLVKGHLSATGKPRFMSKQTANAQRIGVIDKMFPEACYVHIIRDGRAVANSLLRVDWWSGTDIWWLGGKPEKWVEMGREPIELCALQWQRDVQEIMDHRHLFDDRYIEIRYEDLVKDTRGIVRDVVQFVGLGQSERLMDSLPESLPNMNRKWVEQLDKAQKAILEQCIGESLASLGYRS